MPNIKYQPINKPTGQRKRETEDPPVKCHKQNERCNQLANDFHQNPLQTQFFLQSIYIQIIPTKINKSLQLHNTRNRDITENKKHIPS